MVFFFPLSENREEPRLLVNLFPREIAARIFLKFRRKFGYSVSIPPGGPRVIKWIHFTNRADFEARSAGG